MMLSHAKSKRVWLVSLVSKQLIMQLIQTNEYSMFRNKNAKEASYLICFCGKLNDWLKTNHIGPVSIYRNRKEDGSSRWDFKYVNLMWNFGDKCSQQYNKRDLAGSGVLKNISISR